MHGDPGALPDTLPGGVGELQTGHTERKEQQTQAWAGPAGQKPSTEHSVRPGRVAPGPAAGRAAHTAPAPGPAWCSLAFVTVAQERMQAQRLARAPSSWPASGGAAGLSQSPPPAGPLQGVLGAPGLGAGSQESRQRRKPDGLAGSQAHTAFPAPGRCGHSSPRGGAWRPGRRGWAPPQVTPLSHLSRSGDNPPAPRQGHRRIGACRRQPGQGPGAGRLRGSLRVEAGGPAPASVSLPGPGWASVESRRWQGSSGPGRGVEGRAFPPGGGREGRPSRNLGWVQAQTEQAGFHRGQKTRGAGGPHGGPARACGRPGRPPGSSPSPCLGAHVSRGCRCVAVPRERSAGQAPTTGAEGPGQGQAWALGSGLGAAGGSGPAPMDGAVWACTAAWGWRPRRVAQPSASLSPSVPVQGPKMRLEPAARSSATQTRPPGDRAGAGDPLHPLRTPGRFPERQLGVHFLPGPRPAPWPPAASLLP